MTKGWIALDIDGTITDRTHQIPKAVISFLRERQNEGWQLIFITGRTFAFGYSVLHVFDLPYYLAVQNGADLLLMPKRELIARHYLDSRIIPQLEEVYRAQKEDFIVYAGFEQGDFCYYRPERFSPAFLVHLEKIKALSPEPWRAMEHFTFDPKMRFPLIKCLGSEEAMQAVNAALQPQSEVAIALIRDPLAEQIHLNLVTHKEATKGKVLKRAIKHARVNGPVIAAGDDLNDVSMLEAADMKIVMSSAPQEMHKFADILAKPVEQGGIIEALQEGMLRVQQRSS